jgi:peptide deformylase
MLQMKLCGDLVLREKCSPVANITPELLVTMDEMVQMMKDQNGVGLAAPQVGITQRFLVMMDPDTNEIYRMINPKITSKSEETCVMEEGCLSVLGSDGLPVYSNVRRPASVDVEWMNERGETLRAKMSGVPARIVQHETDHLDGVLFVDYLSGVKREMLMRKVNRGHK